MSVLTPRRRRTRTYLAAEARRAQILDVAKRVFSRRGYRTANVADICEAARIGRGTLYQYFENKEAVLVALMEEIAARVEKVISSRAKLATLPASRPVNTANLRTFCAGRLRQVLDAVFVDEPTLRLVLREARGQEGTVDRVVAMIDDLVFGALEADLKAAQRSGFLRDGDTRLMARFILGGIEKMCLAALSDDDPVDLDAIVETAIDLELFGLLKPEVWR
jgi:AcrR family transcriptional regulator